MSNKLKKDSTNLNETKEKKGANFVEKLRGTSSLQMTTDQILSLTRGENNHDTSGEINDITKTSQI